MIDFAFISPSVSEGESSRPWTRYSDHIGPTEHITPLGERISGKTYCGLLSLAAGIAGWCAHRLNGRTDVTTLSNLVEATFAYQHDWRYFNRKALPHKRPVDDPMEISMVVGAEMAIRNITYAKIFWKTGRIPDIPVFHLAHAVGYILPNPELKKFEAWLYAVSDRLDEIASRPHSTVLPKEQYSGKSRSGDIRDCHGVAFPPDVLDVRSPFDMEMRAELSSVFLRSLDWKKNPLLASPDQLREAGFTGEPYGG